MCDTVYKFLEEFYSHFTNFWNETYLIFAREWDHQNNMVSLNIAVIGFISIFIPLVLLMCVAKVVSYLFSNKNEEKNSVPPWPQRSKKQSGPSGTKAEGSPEQKLSKSSLTLIKESRRWLKQAAFDYNAAKNDLEPENLAPEWVCYKCQQAAEKAIKGLLCLCSRISNILHAGHDLSDLCSLVEDDVIRKQCNELQSVIGFTGQMRYPDKHPYPKVPRDIYSEEKAKEAISLTGDLLVYINDNYFVSS